MVHNVVIKYIYYETKINIKKKRYKAKRKKKKEMSWRRRKEVKRKRQGASSVKQEKKKIDASISRLHDGALVLFVFLFRLFTRLC